MGINWPISNEVSYGNLFISLPLVSYEICPLGSIYLRRIQVPLACARLCEQFLLVRYQGIDYVY